MNPNLASKMGWNAVQVVPTEQMHMLYSNNNLCGCIYVWRQKSITQTHGSYLAQTLLSSHKETRYYKDTQKGLLCMFRYMLFIQNSLWFDGKNTKSPKWMWIWFRLSVRTFSAGSAAECSLCVYMFQLTSGSFGNFLHVLWFLSVVLCRFGSLGFQSLCCV